MSVRAGQTRSRGSRAARLWLPLAVCLGLASSQCTFPEYELRGGVGSAGMNAHGGSSAGAGSGSGAVPLGGVGTGAAAGTSTQPLAGAAGEGGNLPGPECAPEQWPRLRCPDTCLRRLPSHCYDGEATGDETAVDCGGSCQGCTNARCESDADCLSGPCVAGGPDAKTCSAALVLSYTPQEGASSVATASWSITLTNQDARAYSFKDLKLRYYFERSGVTEPLSTGGTQSTVQLGSGESRAVAGTWTIVREEGGAEPAYDAYVEVGFTEGGQLFPGDRLELHQQLTSGDPGRSHFDQRANYSFLPEPGPSLRITVFEKDRLVWGLAPRPNHPRACFARAVNVNGPALTVSGNDWQSAAQARVTTSGSGVNQGTTTLSPAVAGALAKALETSTRLQDGQELALPAQNDTYLVYLYAISPTGGEASPSYFTLQGEEPPSSGGFLGQAVGAAQAWAKLGPYRVDATDGEVVVGLRAGSPAMSIAAVELWYPE
ncbi:MAG: hypothetical protein EOO73_33935 [Myxococcales bacterium]|nr:MAG: hypothetical protein EOO73_33935 [Myxococcales bacterium]